MHTARRWQIAVLLSTSVLASFTTFAQSASTRRDQAADLTRGFLAAHAERQSSADPAAALARLSTLAEERRSAMAALVATEPASFLSLAISSEMRDALPASIRNRIEERTEIEGDLEVMVEDYDWGAITRYHVRTQARGRLALYFAADAPALLTDQRVRVRGVLLDADMAVASGTTDVQPLTSVLPSTFGEQRTLLMLVNFIDNTSQPFSLATASDLLLNTVNSFYRENSQNQTWIAGDVVGWFTISLSATVCDYTAIMNGAKAAATGAGVDLSRYRRFVVTFPQNACSWAGLGYVGGSLTDAWINGGSFGTRTLSHELGHNLGLRHAHALECGSSTLGSSCSTLEYGNPVDIMGVPGVVGHFNAFAKERLGWLDYGSSAPLLKVTSAGTFTLSPYATTLSDLKALKVLKSMSGSVPTYYYVEYRHGANFDSTVPAGVFVHTGVEGDGDTSFELDMTPETESWSDAALPTGRTFTDPASGLSITTMAVSGTGATVRIDFGGPLPCSYSLSAASQSMSALGGFGSVNLTTGPSCGWGATSNASWLTPWAASGTGSATVQYTVAANTTFSSRTGTITIGGQPLTVTQAALVQTCSYSLNSSSQSVDAAGGTGSVTVTTDASCGWGVSSNASWLTPSASSGTGSATVQYTVAANTTSSSRTGTLTIGGEAYTMTQAGHSCSFTVSPLSAGFSTAGGSASMSVTTDASCTWTAVANQTWTAITSGASGTGDGTVSYTVEPNSGTSARSGSLTVAGQTIAISQEAGAAVFVSPSAGEKVTAPTLTFQWTAAAGAMHYTLLVGTTPGSSDLVSTSNITTTSYTASSLPDSRTLYATIRTNWDSGGSQYSSSAVSFQTVDRVASIALIGAQVPNPALAGASAQYGTSATTSVEVSFSGSLSGCTATLTATGLPAGVSAIFSPATLQSSATSQYALLTIATTLATPAGSSTFTIAAQEASACGGNTVSASATLVTTAAAENRAPVVTNPGDQSHTENNAVSLSIAASDPDSDALTFSATGLPDGLTINAASGVIDGTLTYASAGSSAVSITVSDGKLATTAAFTWTVSNTNRAPSMAELSSERTPEGSMFAFTISASDPDGDALTYGASNLPPGAVLDATTGVFRWSPAWDQAGNYNVTFSVSDGQLSASQTVKLHVTGSNRKAEFAVLADRANEEGDAVMLTIAATDPDGDTLTLSADGLPGGLVIDPSTGIISGSLRDGSAGVYRITISALDGELSSNATFTWTIRQRPPVPCIFTLSDASASIPAGGGSGVVSVRANATSCTWAATSGASWLTITAGASGGGDGTVKFAVARNDREARSGALTIAGRLFTVLQDAQASGCAVTVTPLWMNAPAGGGSGEFAVAAACPWSVRSDSAWLTVTSATGAGDGTVAWNAQANATPAVRTGKLRIGDMDVVVTQSTARDGVPQDLKAQVNGTQLVLTWQPGRAVAVQEYLVEIGSATGLADVASTHTGTASPRLVAESVSPGTYYVRVRGVASWGVTEASDELVVTINDGEALGAPRQVSSRVSGDSLSLMWLPPASGSAPSGYVIEAGTATGLRDLASIATGTAATSFVTAGVPPGRYYVRLRSAAGGRTSAPSEEISITIGTAACTVAPTAPSSLQSVVVGGQVSLTWAAPAGGEGATSYQIEAGSAPGSSNLSVLDTGSSALSFVASAPPGVYYVRVKARNACGASVASPEMTIVVQP